MARKEGDLACRIKRYEAASHHQLPPRQSLVIRVDGRAFHTYTKGCAKPFDHNLMDAMTHAMYETANDMQGFRLAYTQSDEATFLLTDTDTLTTQGWFDYDLNKVVSISASLFTAHFNERAQFLKIMRGHSHPHLATFDSRAFIVPEHDVPNVFVWRQQDWERNSLQMLARSHFSQKQLHGKGRQEMHDMLHGIGVNWADLLPAEKNGTFLLRDGSVKRVKADYFDLMDWIGD